MAKNKYLSLVLILIITFAASAIGSFTTSAFKEPWYSQIILPTFNPPSWVFGPVWTTLYVFMSIAIWKAWSTTRDEKLLKIYFIHLFFNAIWSIIFFGFHNIGLALINLIIILSFIILTMFKPFLIVPPRLLFLRILTIIEFSEKVENSSLFADHPKTF